MRAVGEDQRGERSKGNKRMDREHRRGWLEEITGCGECEKGCCRRK